MMKNRRAEMYALPETYTKKNNLNQWQNINKKKHEINL